MGDLPVVIVIVSALHNAQCAHVQRQPVWGEANCEDNKEEEEFELDVDVVVDVVDGEMMMAEIKVTIEGFHEDSQSVYL